MKFKKLNKNQIIISIDRLTRFKSTEEKYVRVFKDIIISNLVEPKFKKSDIERMEYTQLRDIAVEIFNSSLDKNNTADLSINKLLKEYENSVFNNNAQVNILLDNCLDFKSAIQLLENPVELNLRWLQKLNNCSNLEQIREDFGLHYPISLVILVEGITEEILLPEFAEKLGLNFYKHGIKVIPAGGKNQVVKLYYTLSEELKIPIFVLLDKDASDNFTSIQKRLRKTDSVHLLNSGEFEDLLPLNLIIDTINSHLKNFATVSEEDFPQGVPMVKTLENIFKEKGIHEFKKAEFAQLIRLQLKDHSEISDEVKNIVEEIKKMA